MEEAVRNQIREFLTSKGLRKTTQRDAIIEAAFSTDRHYTADELLEMARGIEASVSRATVYRTLTILVESGLLRELDLGQGRKVYDPNFVDHPHHNHLICLDCQTILEFEDLNRSEEHGQAHGFHAVQQTGAHRGAVRRVEIERRVPKKRSRGSRGSGLIYVARTVQQRSVGAAARLRGVRVVRPAPGSA